VVSVVWPVRASRSGGSGHLHELLAACNPFDGVGVPVLHPKAAKGSSLEMFAKVPDQSVKS